MHLIDRSYVRRCIIAVACCLLFCTAYRIAGAQPFLPATKIIGLQSLRAPIPFNHSNRVLVEFPYGVFREYGGPNDIGDPIIVGQGYTSIAISGDDTTLFSLHFGILSARRISDGKLLRHVFLPLPGRIPGRSVFRESGDGRYLFAYSGVVTGSGRGVLGSFIVLRADDFSTVRFLAEVGLRSAVTLDGDGEFFYVVIGDQDVRKVSLETGEESHVGFVPTGLRVNGLAYGPDGLMVLSSTQTDTVDGIFTNSVFEHFVETVHPYSLVWTGTDVHREADFPSGAVGVIPGDFNGTLFPRGNALTFDRDSTTDFVDLQDTSNTLTLNTPNASYKENQQGTHIAAITGGTGAFDVFDVHHNFSSVLHVEPAFLYLRVIGGPNNAFVANPHLINAQVFESNAVLISTLQCPPGSSSCEADAETWIRGTTNLLGRGQGLKVWDSSTGNLLLNLFSQTYVKNFSLSHDQGVASFLQDHFEDTCQLCYPARQTLEVRSTQSIIDGIETGGLSIETPGDDFTFVENQISPDGRFIYAVAAQRGRATNDLLLKYSATTGALVASTPLARDLPDEGPSYATLSATSDGSKLYAGIGGFNGGQLVVFDGGSVQFLGHFSNYLTTHVEVLNAANILIARVAEDITFIFDLTLQTPLARVYSGGGSLAGLEFAVTDDGNTLQVPVSESLVFYDLHSAIMKAMANRHHFLQTAPQLTPDDLGGDGILDAADYVVME